MKITGVELFNEVSKVINVTTQIIRITLGKKEINPKTQIVDHAWKKND